MPTQNGATLSLDRDNAVWITAAPGRACDVALGDVLDRVLVIMRKCGWVVPTGPAQDPWYLFEWLVAFGARKTAKTAFLHGKQWPGPHDVVVGVGSSRPVNTPSQTNRGVVMVGRL